MLPACKLTELIPNALDASIQHTANAGTTSKLYDFDAKNGIRIRLFPASLSDRARDC